MSWEIEFMPGENGFTVKPKLSFLHLGQFGDYASRYCKQLRLIVDEDPEFDIMEVADVRSPELDIEEQIKNAIEWLKPRDYRMYGDVRYATSESVQGVFYVHEDGRVEDVVDVNYNPGPSWAPKTIEDSECDEDWEERTDCGRYTNPYGGSEQTG